MGFKLLAGDILPRYKGSDVTVIRARDHDEGVIITFDTSDGKHWFYDNGDISETADSLHEGVVIEDRDGGYMFQPEVWDEDKEAYVLLEPVEIRWVETIHLSEEEDK